MTKLIETICIYIYIYFTPHCEKEINNFIIKCSCIIRQNVLTIKKCSICWSSYVVTIMDYSIFYNVLEHDHDSL